HLTATTQTYTLSLHDALPISGIRALLSLSPGNIPRIGLDGSNVSLDWRVLGFTLALSMLTGILFGLVPALQSSRADLSSTLKERDRKSTRLNSSHVAISYAVF